MKNHSIKTKLTFLAFIAILISFVSLGFYNAKTTYNSEYNLVKEQEINLAKNIATYLGSYFKSKLTVLEATSDALSKEQLEVTNENITEKLKTGLKASDSSLLFFGFEKNGYSKLSTGKYLTPLRDNYDSRKRGWYKSAVANNSSGVTLPYLSKSLQKMVVSLYTPTLKDGERIGVLGSDILLDRVIEVVTSAKVGKSGYAYIVDGKGKILIHKKQELINKQSAYFKEIKKQSDSAFAEVPIKGEKFLVAYDKIPNTNWYLCVKVPKSELDDQMYKNIQNEIFLYVLLLVLVLVVLYFSLSKIMSPLNSFESGLTSFFKYLKGEENHVEALNINTNDEFGTMGRLIDEQVKIITKQVKTDKVLIDDVKRVVNRLKEGKLDFQIEKSASNDSLNDLKHSINEMIEIMKKDVNDDITIVLKLLESYSKLDFTKHIDIPKGEVARGLNNLCQIITEMLKENKINGMQLNDSSNTLLENVNVLNRSSNETAVSLEETASALEEITSTVINNTSRIGTMSEYSNDLKNSIIEGKKLANSTVEAMNEINEESNAIAEAITVIDQISFQTNILSLNAAVEAATAGEAGKGFAVVAQEVRNLASRSAEAAKKIKDLVEKAINRADVGKNISGQMIEGYVQISQNVEKTTSLIEEIKTASSEQRTSIEQINVVVNRLDEQTQNNASVANQTQEIASNTANIAQTILNSANQKQFNE